MKKSSFSIAVIVAVMAFVVSCKPTIPDYVIDPDTMEDVLYDYHMAEGAAARDYKETNFKKSMYAHAVFKKYGITEEQFDTSMVYYMANTQHLHRIYRNLAEKFSKQAESMGSTAGLITIENASDTASIWRGATALLLQPVPPYNRHSFELIADTSFHEGDKVIMNFNSKFLWQDGVKDGALLLAVKYKNDSVASRIVHVASSSHYNISIFDNNHRGIKSIFGCFHISGGNNSTPSSTLKLLFIDNISLVRMHEQKSKNTDEKTDSVRSAPNTHHPTTVADDSTQTPLAPNKSLPQPMADSIHHLSPVPLPSTPNAHPPSSNFKRPSRGGI